VQPFFVSEEKLARQAYRYDSRYRLAAFILMAAILLQMPFLLLLYYQKLIAGEQETRHELALQKKAQMSADLGSLKETEGQLDQIRSWEPILRGRMPTSAVLGAIEQTIPRDIVLSRIALEALNYRPVSLGSGLFRVPEAYTITLEGDRKVQDPAIWQKFIEKLNARLPPGSRLLSSFDGVQGRSDSSILPCKAVLQAQANGEYFPLGVHRIDTEESL
jgi:hypothetical protein